MPYKYGVSETVYKITNLRSGGQGTIGDRVKIISLAGLSGYTKDNTYQVIFVGGSITPGVRTTLFEDCLVPAAINRNDIITDIAKLKGELEVLNDRLNFMNEVKADSVDDQEMKIYLALKAAAGADNHFEAARKIAKILHEE